MRTSASGRRASAAGPLRTRPSRPASSLRSTLQSGRESYRARRHPLPDRARAGPRGRRPPGHRRRRPGRRGARALRRPRDGGQGIARPGGGPGRWRRDRLGARLRLRRSRPQDVDDRGNDPPGGLGLEALHGPRGDAARGAGRARPGRAGDRRPPRLRPRKPLRQADHPPHAPGPPLGSGARAAGGQLLRAGPGVSGGRGQEPQPDGPRLRAGNPHEILERRDHRRGPHPRGAGRRAFRRFRETTSTRSPRPRPQHVRPGAHPASEPRARPDVDLRRADLPSRASRSGSPPRAASPRRCSTSVGSCRRCSRGDAERAAWS